MANNMKPAIEQPSSLTYTTPHAGARAEILSGTGSGVLIALANLYENSIRAVEQ